MRPGWICGMRRPSDFFPDLIPTHPSPGPRIPITSLECAVVDKHRVLPVFIRKHQALSPSDATLTRMPISVHSKEFTGKLSPLESALTKNTGVGGPPNVQPFNLPTLPIGPIAGDGFWCHNPRWHEKRRQSRETNRPRPVSNVMRGHCFLMPTKRTSGIARFCSRLQVVPGSSVL
jgi:hypothetical protein